MLSRAVIGIWLMLCPFLSAEAAFNIASTNRVGLHPVSIAGLSVHGNTNQDLVVANGNEFTLTVLTNAGGATFGSNATINLFGAPTSVVTGYFHNTNSYDIATCQYGTNIISVFTNAAGVYGLAETLPTGVQPTCLTVADVNQDGRPDLICANGAANNVMIFTNDGSGNLVFASAVTVDIDPVYVTTADMNLDGYPDILTANELGNSVSVLLNDTTGNFPLSVSFNVGAGPTSLTTFDMNGDGYPDVVTANVGTNTLTILTNDTTGSLVFVTNMVVNPHPVSISKIGTNFITLVTQTNLLSVFAVNQPAAWVTITNFPTGRRPDCIFNTDINGDGRPDIIIADGGTNLITTVTNFYVAVPPVAVNYYVQSYTNTAFNFAALSGCYSPNGGMLSLTGVTYTNCTASISGANVAGVTGSSFVTNTIGYGITDGFGYTNYGIIFITISAPLLPTMTSSNAPSGLVTAGGDCVTNQAYLSMDGNSGTYWTVNPNNVNSGAVAWLQYQFSTTHQLTSAVMSFTGTLGSGVVNYQGSNDGVTWSTLSVSGTSATSSMLTTTFFAGPYYSYFRFGFTMVGITELNTIQVYGY